MEKGTEHPRVNDLSYISNCDAESTACILYTSGTTGNPKGVIIQHNNIHNSMYWWRELVDLTQEDKVLHFSSYSFVMSLRQIFPTFAFGATLVVPSSPAEFGDAISMCFVTKMALTPSALATVNATDALSLKVVQVAGEAPSKELSNQWASFLDAFYIGLGPTECCGHACCGKFEVDNSVNIGMPVSNAAVYILNESGEIQPTGVVGELCVAGSNISGGYLNRDDLNAKHFVENPFDKSKLRMYKVGDLARRLPDGKIEFIGRRDAQIKIRGFRVETKEIIDAILKHDKVTGSEVLFHKIDGAGHLSAYITPVLNTDEINDLRKNLVEFLPGYMIPSNFTSLESFPLNKNGKCDKKSLPIPSFGNQTDGSIIEDLDIKEIDLSDIVAKTVVSVWMEELQLKDEMLCFKQKSSSFFALGGTSLTAVTTIGRINKTLSTNLKVSDLIAHDSLDVLIDYVSAQRNLALTKQRRPVDISDMLEFHGDFSIQRCGKKLPPLLFAIIQASFAIIVMVGLLAPLAMGAFVFYWLTQIVGFPAVLPLLPAVYATIAVVNLLLTRMIIILSGANCDSQKCFAYPVASIYFLRWWMVQKIVANTCNMFWFANGSRVMVWVFRALGAEVGDSVAIDKNLWRRASLGIHHTCA